MKKSRLFSALAPLCLALSCMTFSVSSCIDLDPSYPWDEKLPLPKPDDPTPDKPDNPGDNPGSGDEIPTVDESLEIPQLVFPAPVNTSFQRVAYFPSYRSPAASAIGDATLNSLTVACYAFAPIGSNYTVTLEQPERAKTLIQRCHAKGLKVVLSFNGTSATFKSMVSTRANRKIFIDSVMKLVDTYGFDGVDNDWEYPSAGDASAQGNMYLMKELSNKLHHPSVGKLLTAAITPGKYAGNVRNGILDEVFDCVDWFNVMCYDDYSTSSEGVNHASYELLTNSYNYWVGTRKLDKSKYVGGIPCYGRPSGITQTGTALGYASILSQGGSPDSDTAVVKSSSYENGTVSYTILYNGRQMVRSKVRFMLDKKAGGYMFWEAGQDTNDERSLIRTAKAVV